MGKGGAGKQHIQATPKDNAQLKRRFEKIKETSTPEGDLLNKFWWMITETTLSRFITANNCDIDGAEKQVLAHLAWRGEYDVEQVLKEDFSDMAARNELYWRSFDHKGHPVLVWNAARHNGEVVSPERYTRYFVYLLESGQREFFGGPEKPGMFCVLVNAKGAGRKNLDFPMMKCAGPIIELNYPERQYRTYVVSVGTLISFAWRVVSNFLDPGTVFKIRLVSGFSDKDLLEDFTPERIKDIESTSLVPVGQEIVPLPDTSKKQVAEEKEYVDHRAAEDTGVASNGGDITDAVVSAPHSMASVENAIARAEAVPSSSASLSATRGDGGGESAATVTNLASSFNDEHLAEATEVTPYDVPRATPQTQRGNMDRDEAAELDRLKKWEITSLKIMEQKDQLFNDLLGLHIEALSELSLAARALSEVNPTVGQYVRKAQSEDASVAASSLKEKSDKLKASFLAISSPLNTSSSGGGSSLDQQNEFSVASRKKWKKSMAALRERLKQNQTLMAPNQQTVKTNKSIVIPSSPPSSPSSYVPPSPQPDTPGGGGGFEASSPNLASTVLKAKGVQNAKRRFLFSKSKNKQSSTTESTTSPVRENEPEDFSTDNDGTSSASIGMPSLESIALSLSTSTSNQLQPNEKLIAAREVSMDMALRSCGRATADREAAMICLKIMAAQLALSQSELGNLRSLHRATGRATIEKNEEHAKLSAELESLRAQLSIANSQLSSAGGGGITSAMRSLLGSNGGSASAQAFKPPPPQTPPPASGVLQRAGLTACVPRSSGTKGRQALLLKGSEPMSPPVPMGPGLTVLNTSKVWVSKSRDALDVAASLLKMMNEVIAACHPDAPIPLPFVNGDITTGGSNGWNQAVKRIGVDGFAKARALPAYKEISLDAAELQRVDMEMLFGRSRHGRNMDESSDERSFYLSLLNLITMHATVCFGCVDVRLIVNPNGIGKKVAYNVGGELLTLNQIKERLDASAAFSF